jgi:FkbM family methyltransferase
MRVLSGALAGKRWLSTAGPHGCWIGIYERDLQHVIVERVHAGDVFYDIGANVGFFTLLAAARVGPTGRVIAVEPVPRNVDLLRRHLVLNAIENVSVFAVAVADQPGEQRFDAAASPSMGHLDAGGSLAVQVTTIDELVATGSAPPPQVIKMDVEGAESRVLAGAVHVLRAHRPIVLLSTHGYRQNEDCTAFLQAQGYSVRVRRDGGADGQYELVAKPA